MSRRRRAGIEGGARKHLELPCVGDPSVVVQPEQSIQANALRLLKAIEQATQGSARPAVLDELRDHGLLDAEYEP